MTLRGRYPGPSVPALSSVAVSAGHAVIRQRTASEPDVAAPGTPEISFVLPCLNEVDSVGAVVGEARSRAGSSGRHSEVIVVDNGSTDGSDRVAREAGAVVVREPRRGYGSAYLAGFRAARGRYIVMVDADGTYDLSSLPAFLQRLDAGDDLVVGSRFRGRIAPGAMPLVHRYVGNPVLSGLLNAMYRTGVGDAHCGMRAFRREALRSLNLRMPGMEFASEMIVNASRAGLRIGEVPVDYRVRTGRSKLSSVRDGWRHLRFLFLYSPTHLFMVPGTALFLVGAILLIALLPGPLTIAGAHMDIHYMVLGALLTLLGAQVVALGLCAKTLAVSLGLQPIDRVLGALRRTFTLERGLLLGGGLAAFGLWLDASIAVSWIATGFGALDQVRPALFASTAVLLGVQTAFSSLFLSLIDLQVGRTEPSDGPVPQ